MGTLVSEAKILNHQSGIPIPVIGTVAPSKISATACAALLHPRRELEHDINQLRAEAIDIMDDTLH